MTNSRYNSITCTSRHRFFVRGIERRHLGLIGDGKCRKSNAERELALQPMTGDAGIGSDGRPWKLHLSQKEAVKLLSGGGHNAFSRYEHADERCDRHARTGDVAS